MGGLVLLKRILFGSLLGMTLIALYVSTKSTSANRVWATQFERVAHFEGVSPSKYVLHNLRSFEYGRNRIKQESWRQIELRTDNIIEAWFFVEPFASSDLFGHTFVSFVVEDTDGDRRTLAVSIEARLEQGEKYSALRGVLREHELSYVWSTEKDTVTRIAVQLGHPLYAYKLNQNRAQAQIILDHFIQRTNALAETPRFYNTVLSNCTNELFKAVNDAVPGSMPSNSAWLLTGRSARYLHAGGLLGNPEQSFDDLKNDAAIHELATRFANIPAEEFSKRWRLARLN